LNNLGVGDWELPDAFIRFRTDADIVAFDRADEGFSHSVALRTFNGRRSRFKTDVASEAARVFPAM
jgi:hypothetical protein